MPKQEWQRPKVLSANSLPDTFGDCVGGSTESGPNGIGSCMDGQNTGSVGHWCGEGGVGTVPGGGAGGNTGEACA
jgi:hypothetical protein